MARIASARTPPARETQTNVRRSRPIQGRTPNQNAPLKTIVTVIAIVTVWNIIDGMTGITAKLRGLVGI